MDYQVSARKYRPGTFDDVIGQPHIVQTLMNAVATKRIAHAYLFSGTRGVGKTTIARILAKALNCEEGPTDRPCNTCTNCQEVTQGVSVDVIEIDGASNTSVDDVREIRENVKFTPFRGHYRVYIIDEVHMLSNSAFNALLKTLEEPPAHVVFIFATTEVHKIPATILSRCQHYNFRRIARAEIVGRLRAVAQLDQLQIEDRSLNALARASEGSMRDALSLLDQAIAFGGKSINYGDLETLLGGVPQESVQDLIKTLLAQDSPAALAVLANALDQGHDVRAFCAETIEAIRNLLVASVVSDPAELRGLIEMSGEDLKQLTTDAGLLTPEQLQELLTIFAQTEDSLRFSAHPRFLVEAAAIRATRLTRTRETGGAESTRSTPSGSPGRSRVIRSETGGRDSTVSSGSATAGTAAQSQPVAPASSGPSRAQPSPPSSNPKIRRDPELPSDPSRGERGANRPTTSLGLAVASSDENPITPISLNWESVQEEVASSFPNIAPFLEAGQFLGIEGNLITIGFAKQATVARAMLEKDDNLRTLTALCERQAGRPVRMRVVELAETEQTGLTMAQQRALREKEQRLVLLERARANPAIKQALEIFGAELAEVRTVAQKEAGE